MLKRILTLVLTIAAVVGVATITYVEMCHGNDHNQQSAQTHTGHGPSAAIEQKTSGVSVNVGNKVCPVSGEKVGKSGMDPVTYEYKGKIYNFCCAMCIDEFKKDPEKYIKKVDEELKSRAQTEPGAGAMPKSSMPMEMHQGHQH